MIGGEGIGGTVVSEEGGGGGRGAKGECTVYMYPKAQNGEIARLRFCFHESMAVTGSCFSF